MKIAIETWDKFRTIVNIAILLIGTLALAVNDNTILLKAILAITLFKMTDNLISTKEETEETTEEEED